MEQWDCGIVLKGTETGMEYSFGFRCHGACHALTRAKSRSYLDYMQISHEMQRKGIAIRDASPKLVMEEAPSSYKNVTDVVDT